MISDDLRSTDVLLFRLIAVDTAASIGTEDPQFHYSRRENRNANPVKAACVQMGCTLFEFTLDIAM